MSDSILPRRFTEQDTDADIIWAIGVLAKDERARVMKDDHIEWLETKLTEIGRLVGILTSRPSSPFRSVEITDGSIVK